MRQKIVAGNWKMNGGEAPLKVVLDALDGQVKPLVEKGVLSVLIFPAFPYLGTIRQFFDNREPFIGWGGQNLSVHEQGAYTGEVSASMLGEFGSEYVLVGHSERRSLYGEDDGLVAEKFAAAQKGGLKPVLCVGETLEAREAGDTMGVVIRQVEAVIERCGITAFTDAVLAYEPVWAIGTGLTASPEQAQEVHQELRHYLSGIDGEVAENLSILYGGSVKADNAAGLFAMADVDGALVGGASLDAAAFVGICRAV